MSSPSVTVQEIDKSHYVPNFTNEVGCFVGYFEKGPINKPIFITDINEFKFIFGRGIGLYHNDWYQVYNYLQYASGIWVSRTSGNKIFNASNDDVVYINDEDHFREQYNSIETFGLKIMAQTPGEWGNILSVAVISDEEYETNEEIYNGIYAQNVFNFFEPGYVGICIFRKGKLVERFYKTEETADDINTESRYIYIKYNKNLVNHNNRIDMNEGEGSHIIDLNQTIDLNFSNDLNVNYNALIKPSQNLYDMNTTSGIYDLNTESLLPFLNDLNYNSSNRDYVEYYTYFGDNIIRLTGGSTNFPTDFDIQNSYDIFENKNTYDVDIIVGNDKHNNAAINLAESRRDAMAFIGIPTSFIEYMKLLMGPDSQETAYSNTGLVLGTRETTIPFRLTDEVWTKFNEYVDSIQKSQFVHFTMNVKEQLDGFTGKYKLVNIAGDIAGLKSEASLKQPWSVGAGLERGRVKNIKNLFFGTSETDSFYKKGLNYIKNNILVTQKTYYTEPNSFSRVNIRSLFNHIEKEVQKLLRYYVFEENTYQVRGIIASTVRKYLEDVKVNNGIDAGKVHVHGKNNEIIVDVYIKPKFAIEFIQLRMKNVGSETITNLLSNTLA